MARAHLSLPGFRALSGLRCARQRAGQARTLRALLATPNATSLLWSAPPIVAQPHEDDKVEDDDMQVVPGEEEEDF